MSHKDLHNCQFISKIRYDDYDYYYHGNDRPDTSIDTIRSLSDLEKCELAKILISAAGQKLVKATLNSIGYYTNDQIKESKEIKVSNLDDLYYDEYGLKPVKRDASGAISNWDDIERIENLFIRVAPTNEMRNQFDKYQEFLAETTRKKEAKKQERKLKKAEKLLKEAGRI